MRSSEPQVVSVERDGGAARITLIAQPELNCFEGHFTECELLPGVVQTHWAIELGRAHLDIRGGFRELKNVKFVRVVQPGARLTLRLTHDAEQGALCFEYRCGEALCSSGAVLFDP